MKVVLPILKNKFILTFVFFLVYILFIDDNDIFYISNQKSKLNNLEERHSKVKKELAITRSKLNKVEDLDYLEAYARENKFFKKDDEDVFVITYK